MLFVKLHCQEVHEQFRLFGGGGGYLKDVMFFNGVCLLVHLLFNNITQKIKDGF